MPPLQPSRAVLRAARNIHISSTRTTAIRSFTSTPSRAADTTVDPNAAAEHAEEEAHEEHAHEDHYDPPTGWLFGVKPGEKAEKEGWENVWMYGFFGSLAAGTVAYAFKPDTSIQTWALEEARRRLEVEGILKEPESKS
ncbi:hypothetical protein ONS95_011874 [Cadophora gregata]|uniref:uncharacterized protein n=1 Tax=Cadophora gregata TaxID=51156 RepID=UPI0026DBA39C|nr:uncharacterized protein ONS95_011874 [Cadophora gregata]KAK0117534.1 hypothetical protein ONS95_011874 [Cadophora gregata]KAK0122587.1 hypothetical protein ONS96_009628 [Cadophora gregata f. sp. sojae]